METWSNLILPNKIFGGWRNKIIDDKTGFRKKKLDLDKINKTIKKKRFMWNFDWPIVTFILFLDENYKKMLFI